MKPASPIHLLERDYFLQFDRPLDLWPPEDLQVFNVATVDEKPEPGIWMAGAWNREILEERQGGYLWRELKRIPRESDPPRRRETTFREAMLRFPSAPLFGSQSKIDFQVRMKSFHQHTLRLLTSARAGDQPIGKLFLIFNGLNELDQLGFYYDLAGLLIEGEGREANVACLLVPFPGHLARYPLIGKYAEKPLQRFISDPSDLFRQYLRFMVETQWLISALVPIGYYPVTSGIPLLEPNEDPSRSRCNPEVLSPAIYEAWGKIFSYSKKEDPEIRQDDVLQSIAVLRRLIGWRASSTELAQRDKNTALDPPQLHVIGYSLGGYLAQSVFFAWPYAIGSCSTLCSGGALTSLRPEKIIHEEEWRAITHGLKYDIDSGMLEGRIGFGQPPDPTSVCGIPVSSFTSHFQTFTDIFLQDPYGTYRHRVSEFAPRMFFVVGGNDPIVPTQLVLDTSPPEGINMIEIARLSHFIAIERGEWADFWLPTVTSIISSLSDHSEKLLKATTLDNLWNYETSNAAHGDVLDLKTLKERAAKAFGRRVNADRRDPEPMNSEELQETIVQFVESLKENKGFLLVLRNQIPVTLMGTKVLHRRGTVPHYADFEIGRFWARLQEQRLGMLAWARRVAIVVPGRLNEWFVQRLPILSFKHLPVVQESEDQELRQREIWDDFLNDWETTGGLYRFNPEHPTNISGDEFKLEQMVREDTATPDDFWVLNCLPDVWINLSEAAVAKFAGGVSDRDMILNTLKKYMLLTYNAGRKGKPATTDDEKARKDLHDLLEAGALQILRISAAQSSPRYLGERIHSRSVAIDLLTHGALALARSRQCHAKGDFAKEWRD